MKPRQFITIEEDLHDMYEHLEKEYYTEDDLMERERDIRDSYDDDDADDLRDIDIG